MHLFAYRIVKCKNIGGINAGKALEDIKMTTIGVLFGGRSGEHEISLMSAASVIKAIDKTKYKIVMIGITKQGKWLKYDGPFCRIEDGGWQKIAETALEKDPKNYGFTVLGTGKDSLKEQIDFALPILHGPYGEDGTVQGLFEMLNIPYGGCGVAASSICMDKGLAKAIFAKEGLPQVCYRVVCSEDLKEEKNNIIQKLSDELGFPVFVKPANMGSSVGVGKVKDRKELEQALFNAAKYDRRILVEEYIDCREIETGVLGNLNPEVAAVGEIIPSAEFYDYRAKYFDGGKSKLCIPADITKEQTETIQEIAEKAYRATDCCGFARVDFFINKKTGKIYLNEINTIPGFTKYSMFPLLWEAVGVPYSTLIERIITLGYERHYVKNHW